MKRIVKVVKYVTPAEGFGDQPKVVNGVSELLIEVSGERGYHTHSAVGIAETPGGSHVDVDIIAEMEA